MHDRVDRVRYEIGAVVNRDDFGAGWQFMLQVCNARFERGIDFRGVAALGHRNDPFDDAVLIADGNDAVAWTLRFCHLGDIANGNRLTLPRGDDDLANIVKAVEQTRGAHDQRCVTESHKTTARAAVAVIDGLTQLVQRDLVLAKLQRIDLDMELLDRPAKADDIRNAGCHAQHRPNHPVLQRANFRVGQARGLDRVAIDLANRR